MTGIEGTTILVTGGAGFIGSHVVDALLATDVRSVTVLDNLVNGSVENLLGLRRDPRLRLVSGDVRDVPSRASALDGVDVVLHLACLGVRHSIHDPAENHSVNAGGTLGLLQDSLSRRVRRFVYVSTSEVFGTAQYTPMDERHPTWPETVYGGSKLAGEAYARAFFRTYEMDTVVVRPFNTYGPRSHFEGDSGEVIPRTVVRVLNGQRPLVFGDGRQTRDLMYVTDTAAALVAIAESTGVCGETLNLGSGHETSVVDLCRTIALAAGRADLEPQHLDARPGDVRRLLGDPSRVRDVVGFQPRVPLETGIARVLEWFRKGDAESMSARIAERNWLMAEAGR